MPAQRASVSASNENSLARPEPERDEIPAEDPVVERRAEQRVRDGERHERTETTVQQSPDRTGDERHRHDRRPRIVDRGKCCRSQRHRRADRQQRQQSAEEIELKYELLQPRPRQIQQARDEQPRVREPRDRVVESRIAECERAADRREDDERACGEAGRGNRSAAQPHGRRFRDRVPRPKCPTARAPEQDQTDRGERKSQIDVSGASIEHDEKRRGGRREHGQLCPERTPRRPRERRIRIGKHDAIYLDSAARHNRRTARSGGPGAQRAQAATVPRTIGRGPGAVRRGHAARVGPAVSTPLRCPGVARKLHFARRNIADRRSAMRRTKATFSGIVAALLVAAAGCAGNQPATSASIEEAEQRIDEAERADAQRYANRELNMAREKLIAAREAQRDGDEERAARLPERAELDAALAIATADNESIQAAVDELRTTLATLESELERQQDPGTEPVPPAESDPGPEAAPEPFSTEPR